MAVKTEREKLAICPDHPRCWKSLILHVGTCLGIVLSFKFIENRLRCFGDPVGQKSPFPITLAGCFYNNLCYCTGRDVTVMLL